MFRLKSIPQLIVLMSLAGAALTACAPLAAQAAGGTGPLSRPVQVDDVAVEFGRGSPYPVNAVIGISLPTPCAQLSQITQTLDGRVFSLTVEAQTPAECRPDSLPYRLALPLNMANVEPGRYTVTVNGISAEFDFPPAAP